MKKLRPTIPVDKWKLAVNLESTRQIQNQKGTPAYGCECKSCANWRASLDEVIPTQLREEMTRVGINLKCPTDLYEFESNNGQSSIRVLFHAVGKILSGPNQWKATEFGKSLLYSTVSFEPNVALVVIAQNESLEQAPVFQKSANGELIQIDLRVQLP